jgi:NADH:ubiquinone oxidoreductase subunit 5 (subunit L)/multisubunit Na+/H+ antiporter MnhA subunit
MSDIEFINLFFLLPLLMSLSGLDFFFIYAFGLSHFYNEKTKSFKVIYNFLNRKWYFDKLYNELIAQN